MNNQQFRNLLIGDSQKKDGSARSPSSPRPSATPALGSRKSSSIPMTPRQVGGRGSVNAEFARQLAERNVKANAVKKFKSSAPKGVKLAAGYTDRTKNRADDEQDETAQRIQKLEEAMKLGQLDRETFESLVQEITGGEIGATHLVKGLDRKLLERIRKGEDVRVEKAEREDEGEAEKELQVEDQFDELEEQEIAPVVRQLTEKKGEMAPPPPVAGVKRSRNDILAELKAQRKAAADAAAAEHEKKYPSLGPGFRKVGPGGETSRIEKDAKGREVLIVTGADGKEKRKVRKQKIEALVVEPRYDIENPDKPFHINEDSLPQPKREESDDDDIFAGVGSNYNPLADLEDGAEDVSSGEDESEPEPLEMAKVSSNTEDKGERRSISADFKDRERTSPPASSSKVSTSTPRRNYFSNILPNSTKSKDQDTADATVLAALAKARQLDPSSTLLQDTEEARLKKRAAQLAANDRDMQDLDMGFGGSRFDDADDMEREGEKVRFSEWKGLGADNDEDDGQEGRAGKKRKRGPKKKKGDKNSAADVLQVMERQRGAKSLG